MWSVLYVHERPCVLDCYRRLHIPAGPTLPIARFLVFVYCILVCQEIGNDCKLKSDGVSSYASGQRYVPDPWISSQEYAAKFWVSCHSYATDCCVSYRVYAAGFLGIRSETRKCYWISGVRYAEGSWISGLLYAEDSWISGRRHANLVYQA